MKGKHCERVHRKIHSITNIHLLLIKLIINNNIYLYHNPCIELEVINLKNTDTRNVSTKGKKTEN